MSSGQQRGRGRGGGVGGSRGGDSRGGRGDSSTRGTARGGTQGGAPRGGSDGQLRGGGGDRGGGRGDRGGARGDRGRGGDFGGGRGRGGAGPPRAGQAVEMVSRGPPPGSGAGGIFGGPAPVPDPTITQAEDRLVANTRGRTIDGFPGRRSFGTQGRKIVLRTNYFKINTKYDSNDTTISEPTLYRYDVDTGTAQLNGPKRRRLLEQLLQDPMFSNTNWASDYGNIIITTEELELPQGNEWRDTLTLPSIGGTSEATQQDTAPAFVQAARSRNRITFRVTRGDSFSLQHIVNYLRSLSAGADYQGRVDVIQLLNIIMCKPPRADQSVTSVGQNKFYPFEGHPRVENWAIGGALEALRGYYVSVRPYINRLLVNVNVTSGAFYKPIPVIDLLRESGLRSNDHSEAFIRMLKVKAEYQKDNESQPSATRVRTIVGFARSHPPNIRVQRFGNAKQVTFSFLDRNIPNAVAEQISIYDYFGRERGITLERPELPVLNVGTRARPEYLPVEICTVLPGQPFRRILGGEQTSEMIKFAARNPNLNAISIAGTQESQGNGLRLFRLASPPSQQDPQLQSVKPFGFGVDTQMITVPGRILSSPTVTYGGNKNVNPQRGSWNFIGQKFAIPGRHGNWQVWVINHAGPKGQALRDNPQREGELAPEALFAELENELKKYGITMGRRLATQTISLDTLNVPNREKNDKKIEQAYQRADAQEVRLVFIVLPDQDRWLYARIKYHGDYSFGIHSINAVGSKFQNPRGQGMFMGNLALKFNIKGGGVSHRISDVLKDPLDSNAMLVGIDVTHPSPGSSKEAPSIACIVASTDQHLSQWPGSIRAQTAREEMVEGLVDMVVERLELWRKKNNNRLPTKVVIYRDGVSEGQYRLVLEHEVPPFKEAFKRLYGPEQKWPKMSVFVVGKRHHTRFYPTRQEDADYNPQRQTGSWNPLPGTVVDRGIVGRDLHEMYLQAHQGLQGTARPAHYVPIFDEIGFEGDQLEQFTHKLCYLFNRATKAVSICPPAYYADLLCERGRCYLFSTLAENNASEPSVTGGDEREWTAGVHPRLRESTWYI